VNFGLPILDFGLGRRRMAKTFWIESFPGANIKSKIQNPKWVEIVAITLTLAMCGAAAQAQQAVKIPRIGYISGGNASNQGPYVEALRNGLRDLGYVDGKNIVIEYRGAEGKFDRISSIVAELVQLQVDILVVPTAQRRSARPSRRLKRFPLSW
jgi:hypothetical protein